ncbi:hypothetical protein GTW69_38685 [Streptomyces sp. SID7760]|nr:hypothetical protein [Streptomyces sp. SID7760]
MRTPVPLVTDPAAAIICRRAVGKDAPGSGGLLLVEAWPTGAAYAWETRDRRLCWASVAGAAFSEQGCATEPAVIGEPRGVEVLATLFTDGWVRLFAADHQQVTSATCGGKPLEVRRVGTVADGARTLYAVWFPAHTKGSVTLSLGHEGTTSEAPLDLGDLGDRTCTTAP